MRKLTCLNGLMAPLIRSESAAIPAMPSAAGSRNCRNDDVGTECGWMHVWPPQHTTAAVLASGCELWRMIRDPEFGDVVMNTGGTEAEC